MKSIRTTTHILIATIIAILGLGAVSHTKASQSKTDGFSCTNITEIPQIECEALVALYNDTDGPNWRFAIDWFVTNTPCSWYRVTCDGGHITRLHLSDTYSLVPFGLQGDLPAEIGNLTGLTELDLRYNQLTSMPAEIGNLTNLAKLDLSRNRLRSLPAEIGNLTDLVELHLWNNEFCNLPTEIGNLTNLTELTLDNNQLTSLPAEIGNLASLTRLELYSNKLSSLPAEFGNLANLTELDLKSNQLLSLPAQIGNLTNLKKLYLWNNELSSLPAEVGNLTSLTTLDLWNNRLSSVPAEIGNLTNLTELDLSWNKLSSLPSEIGNLTNLKRLSLAHNRLVIPGSDLRSFMMEYDSDWADTQTIAPADVKATAVDRESIELTWSPIVFQDKGGYYEISVADGGPFTVHGTTTSKSDSHYVIESLTSGITYDIRIRTYTPAHAGDETDPYESWDDQRNELWRFHFPEYRSAELK